MALAESDHDRLNEVLAELEEYWQNKEDEDPDGRMTQDGRIGPALGCAEICVFICDQQRDNEADEEMLHRFMMMHGAHNKMGHGATVHISFDQKILLVRQMYRMYKVSAIAAAPHGKAGFLVLKQCLSSALSAQPRVSDQAVLGDGAEQGPIGHRPDRPARLVQTVRARSQPAASSGLPQWRLPQAGLIISLMRRRCAAGSSSRTSSRTSARPNSTGWSSHCRDRHSAERSLSIPTETPATGRAEVQQTDSLAAGAGWWRWLVPASLAPSLAARRQALRRGDGSPAGAAVGRRRAGCRTPPRRTRPS